MESWPGGSTDLPLFERFPACNHWLVGRHVDDEPVSPYFGDYPDGAYWSAVPVEGSDDARTQHAPRQPDRMQRLGRSDARTPANPYPIRMFAEIGCDFALWGEVDESPPTRREGVEECDTLEEELPISDGLRSALLSWAADYFHWDGSENAILMDDFDERGFRLSRDMQRELGELYAVRYSFTFRGPYREALLASVADEPLPGWSCRR